MLVYPSWISPAHGSSGFGKSFRLSGPRHPTLRGALGLPRAIRGLEMVFSGDGQDGQVEAGAK